MWNFSKSCLIFITIVFMISACSPAEKKQGNRVKPYANDGYMGLTESNPNLQLSPSYHNYHKDTLMVRKALSAEKNVKKSRVVITGATMRIKVWLPDNLTRSQVGQVKQSIKRDVSFMVPRYRIVITTNKD